VIRLEKYIGGISPSRDIAPEKKTEVYCRKNAEFLYGLWCGSATAWGYDSLSFFNEMRQYSNGAQDTNQYKSFLTNSGANNSETFSLYDNDAGITQRAKRDGYYNLLWQNLSPAPKILNALHGALGSYDYDLYCDTIDANSRGLVEFEKFKKFHEARDIKWQTEYKTKAGIPVDEDANFPKTLEELEAFSAREGFKLNIARAMQKVLRHGFNVSDWDGSIRKKLLDDLITLGYCAAEDLYDDEDRLFKTQWLDPARTVMQFSHEKDYSDAEYGGHFSEWTISNVRRKRPDLTEDELYALAKNNKGNFNNPTIQWGERTSMLDITSNSYLYDDFKVAVFKAYWIDTDTYKSLYYNNNSGREMVKEVGYDEKITPLTKNQIAKGKKQEVKQTKIRVVYQCSWVVGSEICWDHGKLLMGARPQPSKPKIPIHVEQLLQPSIVYRLKPILDSIALTWLQHQNSMAKMIEKGYAVNMSMLMNVTMNGKDALDPAGVLNMWKQTGILPYMYGGANGQYPGGAAIPVTPIDGGLGNRIQETAMALETNFKLIEEIVGINPVAMGSTPTKDSQVGTTEMAMQATSNVLKPIVEGMFEIKQSLGSSLMLRTQIGLRVDKDIRDAYAGIISPSDIKSLVLAEHNSVQYGISLKAKPDDKRKATLLNFITLEVEKGTLGSPEGMYFAERLESGADMIELRQEIAYAIEKGQQRKMQESLATIQEQNKGMLENEQLKGQNEQAKINAEGQVKMAEEALRGDIKHKLQRQQNNAELMSRLFDDVAAEKEIKNDNTRRQA